MTSIQDATDLTMTYSSHPLPTAPLTPRRRTTPPEDASEDTGRRKHLQTDVESDVQHDDEPLSQAEQPPPSLPADTDVHQPSTSSQISTWEITADLSSDPACEDIGAVLVNPPVSTSSSAPVPTSPSDRDDRAVISPKKRRRSSSSIIADSDDILASPSRVPPLISSATAIANTSTHSTLEPLSAYTCPICFSPPSNATLTPCGHICCGQCLFTAVKSTIRRNMVMTMDRAPAARCPVCREEIPGWDGRGGGVIGLNMRVLYSL